MITRSIGELTPKHRFRAQLALATMTALIVVMTGCSGGGTPTASPTAVPPTATPTAAPQSVAPTAPPQSVAPQSVPPTNEPVKIGIISIGGGPFATFELEAFLGAKFALIDLAGGQSGGENSQDPVNGAVIASRPVELYFGASDATPDVAVQQARRLVEQEKVDILLAPMSGDEGVAIANYAKTQPGVTFVNGTSGARITTMKVQAPNFFRFGGDGAQWMAGVGTYAYKTLGWRKVAILAEDYSYPYTLASGFVAEFCSQGGDVTKRIWVPLAATDYASYVAQIPSDVDGTLLLTGGTNTTNAVSAFEQIGGDPATLMLGGSSVMDETTFATGDAIVGMVGGVPVPLGSDDPTWTGWLSRIRATYPSVPAESLFTALYYNGMQAIIEALTQVNGDLSNSHAALNDALAHLQPQFPTGSVTLDQNRNATISAYVTKFVKNGDQMGFELLKTVQNVDETFGGLFSADSPDPGRDSPACEAGTPPPWVANF